MGKRQQADSSSKQNDHLQLIIFYGLRMVHCIFFPIFVIQGRLMRAVKLELFDFQGDDNFPKTVLHARNQISFYFLTARKRRFYFMLA